ncbi:MAG: hypothetical protein NVS1B11_16380 [Terriglobales bacterium]
MEFVAGTTGLASGFGAGFGEEAAINAGALACFGGVDAVCFVLGQAEVPNAKAAMPTIRR